MYDPLRRLTTIIEDAFFTAESNQGRKPARSPAELRIQHFMAARAVTLDLIGMSFLAFVLIFVSPLYNSMYGLNFHLIFTLHFRIDIVPPHLALLIPCLRPSVNSFLLDAAGIVHNSLASSSGRPAIRRLRCS